MNRVLVDANLLKDKAQPEEKLECRHSKQNENENGRRAAKYIPYKADENSIAVKIIATKRRVADSELPSAK